MPSPLVLNPNNTLGPGFIRYNIVCIIFEISTMQTISYFISYRKDSLNLTILVSRTRPDEKPSYNMRNVYRLESSGMHECRPSTTSEKDHDSIRSTELIHQALALIACLANHWHNLRASRLVDGCSGLGWRCNRSNREELLHTSDLET
ncbi:hypothetical protein GYMLUDRAFT_62270 [Collybiopsis luxurians FD-317 M1]|uniref:Uncharacterized protein n=1 Tax=Collybiopsis luxurians FD-317 M1 TaxID=944289 RepID=A0A0D0CD95_9AGAR|nr:hypothetical protein GYMLUDRAFT_62270 [Collybiopsis luxurians FD-317 M1]